MIPCASPPLQSIVKAWLADVSDTPADSPWEEHSFHRKRRAFDAVDLHPVPQTETLRSNCITGRSPLVTRSHNIITPLPRPFLSAGATDHNCFQPTTIDQQRSLEYRPIGRGRQLDRPQAQSSRPSPQFELGTSAGPSTPATARKWKVDKRGSPDMFNEVVRLMLAAGQYDGVGDTPRANSSHNTLIDNVSLPPLTIRSSISQSARSLDETTDTSSTSKKSRSQSPKKSALQHGQDKFHFNDFTITGSSGLPAGL